MYLEKAEFINYIYVKCKLLHVKCRIYVENKDLNADFLWKMQK